MKDEVHENSFEFIRVVLYRFHYNDDGDDDDGDDDGDDYYDEHFQPL